jgi:hypothetical protein
LEILGQNFKHRLCKALGISPHETAENIVNAWKTSVHADTANMGDLIGNYERALSKKHLSDSELRTIVGTCDKIAGTLADSKEEKRRSNS